MAKYRVAIEWIAHNDAAGDTPVEMSWVEALGRIEGMLTVCLVADLFAVSPGTVAADVLRVRGFRKPRQGKGKSL